MSNTDKEYPCIFCGSSGNIIREGANPRIKCNSCNGLYDGQDSLNAKEAGMIPDGLPELKEEPYNPLDHKLPDVIETNSGNVPKSPSHFFVSKSRNRFEFCTKRDFKKTALKWEQEGSYDCFELVPKKISAKIDIQ